MPPTRISPPFARPFLLAAGGALLAAMSATGLGAQSPVDRLEEGRALEATARQALAEGDLESYREGMAAAYGMRPGHQTLLYHWARGYAVADSARQAIALLSRYADMGLGGGVQADEAFAPLARLPEGAEALRRIAENEEPAGDAEVLFRHPLRTFMPEGVAYDPVDDAYYLGSVRLGRIDRIRDGVAELFADRSDGAQWAVMGMEVDARRRILWVATSAVPHAEGIEAEEVGRSAIVAFDLTGARPPRRYEVPRDGMEHWVGDVAVAPDGTVYGTDSVSGAVYRIAPGGALETVLAPGKLASPQGLDVSADGRLLYLADYALGLLVLDVATGSLSSMSVPDDISVLGIDGMRRAGDRLVVIQNGVRPYRVMSLALASDGRGVETGTILLRAHEAFPEPTLGTVVGGDLVLVANSQWFLFDEETGWAADEEFSAPVLLRVPLEQPGAGGGAG